MEERLLGRMNILEPLSPEEIERLAARRSCVRLEAGEIITLEEDRRNLFRWRVGTGIRPVR